MVKDVEEMKNFSQIDGDVHETDEWSQIKLVIEGRKMSGS